MGQKLYVDNYSFREKILLAGIRHIVLEYARLYRARREELWSIFGISRNYKMLGTVRSKEIPFHFLHVQNTNQVIENIYSVVKAEVE